MSDVIITVRGSHQTRIAPELGVAHVSAVAEGPERGPVVEALAAIAQPVRDDLAARKAADTIVDWSSERVTVWAERPWNSEGRQLAPVHHGRVDLTATFDDTMALSDWLNGLAARDGIQIGTVDWQLSPGTRARVERETATAAVAVAVARAEAYAAAIGRDDVTPIEIADLGLLSSGVAHPEGAPMMRMAMAASASDSAIEFRPDDIVITSSVEARFRAV
ncbi:SIMPL domain-containing protein [Microbacterium sp. No. 7]|uniref:SIMPL domain-containing protein n=1 Tax=Microbacterium sp. No. 7 TaxID=1714373 RepID=UPI0006D2680D|nr:SIMPL domain-containing protein [Microbacterium sp. No. 7]ALJ20016.1 neuraminidase [Microbacterium sp. No. 7]